MAIDTYALLKTAIASRADRTDLTSLIPDFITEAATRIHYGSNEPPFISEPLRIRAMEASDDLTISARTCAIPARVVQVRRLYLNTDPVAKLEMVSPDKLWGSNLGLTGDQPSAFAMEGENFVFGTSPDATYTGKLLSYKTFAAFSADADTNWLLTNAPGAYLHGALIALWGHLFDTEQATLAHKRFVGVINALNLSDKSDRYSGPWVGRTDTGNP